MLGRRGQRRGRRRLGELAPGVVLGKPGCAGVRLVGHPDNGTRPPRTEFRTIVLGGSGRHRLRVHVALALRPPGPPAGLLRDLDALIHLLHRGTCKNAREFSSAEFRPRSPIATRRSYKTKPILSTITEPPGLLSVFRYATKLPFRPFLLPTRWRSPTNYGFSVCRRLLYELRLLTRSRWDPRSCNRMKRSFGVVKRRENSQTIEISRTPLAMPMLSLYTKNTAASRAASIDNFPRNDVGKQGRPDRRLVSLLLTSRVLLEVHETKWNLIKINNVSGCRHIDRTKKLRFTCKWQLRRIFHVHFSHVNDERGIV